VIAGSNPVVVSISKGAKMAKVNFCRPGGLISSCTAREMKKCQFYQKSSFGNYCMYRREEIQLDSGDFHCSCVDAQYDARKKLKDDKKLLEKEEREGRIDV
jgi:hypothetical protein